MKNMIFLFGIIYNRRRQKQVMPKCADVQLTMEMHRMLRNVPIVFIKTIRKHCFNLVLIPRDTATHQETHGKEIMTKGVVLKHVKAVATVSERETTFQNFF